MHVEMSIDFEILSHSARNQGHGKRGEVWMCLFVAVFIKAMNGLVMILEEGKKFSCLVSNFADSRMEVPRYISIKSHYEIFFFF